MALGAASGLLGEAAKPATLALHVLRFPLGDPGRPRDTKRPGAARGSLKEFERDRKEMSKCEQENLRLVGRTDTDPERGGGQLDRKGFGAGRSFRVRIRGLPKRKPDLGGPRSEAPGGALPHLAPRRCWNYNSQQRLNNDTLAQEGAKSLIVVYLPGRGARSPTSVSSQAERG